MLGKIETQKRGDLQVDHTLFLEFGMVEIKQVLFRFQVAKQGSNNNTYCTFNQNNPKFGNTKISDSVWSQIVITYDKDSSKLNYYLNSILDTSITMTYSIPSSTNYGNLTFGEVLHGLMDIGIILMVVWMILEFGTGALTLSEVSNLFNECTETYISDTINGMRFLHMDQWYNVY